MYGYGYVDNRHSAVDSAWKAHGQEMRLPTGFPHPAHSSINAPVIHIPTAATIADESHPLMDKKSYRLIRNNQPREGNPF